jgi:uncharacterized caspase-like protein
MIDGRHYSGIQGYDLRQKKVHSLKGAVNLSLTVGLNKIQISCLNSRGVESLMQTINITYNPSAPVPKPELFVIAIGVSRYMQSQHNLNFAAKDATDIAKFFRDTKNKFSRIRALLLVDEEANRRHIVRATRELLKQTKIEDQVVLFLAGHGLLDEKLDYYFGTYDIDFDHPARRGLSYEDIEGLLDGIPARKKLLLMDTCHAGEVDKETTAALVEPKNLATGVRAIAVRAKPGRSYVELGNSFQLMQELFVDLRRGSGAEVIAAAGGVQYAYERGGNGLFTHAVLEGLRYNKADRDKDEKVSVSELRDWVFEQVRLLSGGRQAPTARGENAELDWSIE